MTCGDDGLQDTGEAGFLIAHLPCNLTLSVQYYPFNVLGSFIFLSDGHFLGAKILFLCWALVRNCDIRQKLTLLIVNIKECVLLAAQAGYIAQAGSFYCLPLKSKIPFCSMRKKQSLTSNSRSGAFSPSIPSLHTLMGCSQKSRVKYIAHSSSIQNRKSF